MDRTGGLSRELLKHDRPHEGVVVRAGAALLDAARADARDDLGEDRIHALQVREGGAE